MDYKEKREKFNSCISAIIIAVVLAIVALCFIPLATIEGIFIYDTFEAIFMYIIFAAAAAFFIYGLVKFIMLVIKIKKSDKQK